MCDSAERDCITNDGRFTGTSSDLSNVKLDDVFFCFVYFNNIKEGIDEPLGQR